MWRAAAAGALLFILAGAGASAAAPPELNFACSPGPVGLQRLVPQRRSP